MMGPGRRRLSVFLGVALLAVATAGAVLTTQFPTAPPLPLPEGLRFHLAVLEGDAPHGLSGLARARGEYYAVPERERVLLGIGATATAARALKTWPIEGVPKAVDLEGLAVLPGGRFALTTEHHVDRAEDDVLIAERTGDELRVVDRIAFSYAPWKLTAEGNNGLEAACATEDLLLVAVETVVEADGKRHAPIGIHHFPTGSWRAHEATLTTETGKLAGIECRVKDGAIEVYAIERHYRVSRLVRFTLPLEGAPRRVKAEPLIDLSALTGIPLPNFESLTFVAEKTLLLLADDDPGPAGVPAAVLWVTLPALD